MPVLIQIVCLTTLSVTQNIASNDRMAVNNDVKGKSKKVIDAYLKTVSRHLSGGTENIHVYKIRLG
jgi:hypothetical protein